MRNDIVYAGTQVLVTDAAYYYVGEVLRIGRHDVSLKNVVLIEKTTDLEELLCGGSYGPDVVTTMPWAIVRRVKRIFPWPHERQTM